MGDEQVTIRLERETNNNIFILRNVTERRIENGDGLILAIIDLRVEFNSIEKTIIWKYLEEIKVPISVIKIINLPSKL